MWFWFLHSSLPILVGPSTFMPPLSSCMSCWVKSVKCFTLCFICSAYVPECYDGDVRLSSSENFTLISFNANLTRGYLEVCYQGNWISVCLNSTNGISDPIQIAELACQSTLGSSGMSFKISSVSYQYSSHHTVMLFLFQFYICKVACLIESSPCVTSNAKFYFCIIIWYTNFCTYGMFIIWSCAHFTDYSLIRPEPNDEYSTYEHSAIDFVCNNNSYNLGECIFIVESDPVCQSHADDAFLTCVVGMSCNLYNYTTLM